MAKIKKGKGEFVPNTPVPSLHYIQWVDDTFSNQTSTPMSMFERQNRYYLTALYYAITGYNAWILVEQKTQTNEAKKQIEHLPEGSGYAPQTLNF